MNNLKDLEEALKELPKNIFPHGSNLYTKMRRPMSSNQKDIMGQVTPFYLSIIDNAKKDNKGFDKWLKKHTVLVDTYLEFIRSNATTAFAHQSDFISSVIPEYICCILHRVVKASHPSLLVEGQRDLLIELQFSPVSHGRLHPKLKRVDAAISMPVNLKFQGDDVNQFVIPIVAVEVKTNLDKNMLVGIENSVLDLKKTFPLCKYFVISELCDFQVEDQSYASTKMDEIYVIRQQKRSEWRHTGRMNPISMDCIREFVQEAVKALELVDSDIPSIADRLSKGSLISWRKA